MPATTMDVTVEALTKDDDDGDDTVVVDVVVAVGVVAIFSNNYGLWSTEQAESQGKKILKDGTPRVSEPRSEMSSNQHDKHFLFRNANTMTL